MIQEILKKIDQKKDQEIDNISSQRKEKIAALKERAKKEVEERKEKILFNLDKEMLAEIAGFLQKKDTEVDFALQKEKNIIIEEVWEKVEERINKMPDESFSKIIIFLIKFIPKDIEGEVLSSKKVAAILKKHLKRSNLKIKDNLKEEGFLIKSKNLDLDFRISEVLKQMKEEYNPKIIKILFSKNA